MYAWIEKMKRGNTRYNQTHISNKMTIKILRRSWEDRKYHFLHVIALKKKKTETQKQMHG